MRVLMVTPTYDPVVGGVETVVKELAIRLNNVGTRCDVMTFNVDKNGKPSWREEVKQENGFKVFRVPALDLAWIPTLKSLFNATILPKLNFTKRFKDYDIIHFHCDTDLSFPLFSYSIKKPKILHCHGLNGTYRYYKRNFLTRKWLKELIDFYICVSNSETRLLLDLGFSESKISTLHIGVDTETYVPIEKEKLDNLILYVGRIHRTKGLHILLQALSYVKMQTQLIIIGPVNDVGYLEENKNRIKKSKHKIRYLGIVSKNNLIKWYQRSSVLVSPSLVEPFGIVNLEALACGTPVIGTNIGGIPEIVKDGVNGILVPPNDPKELANALEKLLADQELRKKYAREGRKIVEEHFSWNRVPKELIRIYQSILVA